MTDILTGLMMWLYDHWMYWLLPILGYIIISLIKALAKKGIEKVGYTTEEGKIKIQWKNLTILILLILTLILLFKSGFRI